MGKRGPKTLRRERRPPIAFGGTLTRVPSNGSGYASTIGHTNGRERAAQSDTEGVSDIRNVGGPKASRWCRDTAPTGRKRSRPELPSFPPHAEQSKNGTDKRRDMTAGPFRHTDTIPLTKWMMPHPFMRLDDTNAIYTDQWLAFADRAFPGDIMFLGSLLLTELWLAQEVMPKELWTDLRTLLRTALTALYENPGGYMQAGVKLSTVQQLWSFLRTVRFVQLDRACRQANLQVATSSTDKAGLVYHQAIDSFFSKQDLKAKTLCRSLPAPGHTGFSPGPERDPPLEGAISSICWLVFFGARCALACPARTMQDTCKCPMHVQLDPTLPTSNTPFRDVFNIARFRAVDFLQSDLGLTINSKPMHALNKRGERLAAYIVKTKSLVKRSSIISLKGPLELAEDDGEEAIDESPLDATSRQAVLDDTSRRLVGLKEALGPDDNSPTQADPQPKQLVKAHLAALPPGHPALADRLTGPRKRQQIVRRRAALPVGLLPQAAEEKKQTENASETLPAIQDDVKPVGTSVTSSAKPFTKQPAANIEADISGKPVQHELPAPTVAPKAEVRPSISRARAKAAEQRQVLDCFSSVQAEISRRRNTSLAETPSLLTPPERLPEPTRAFASKSDIEQPLSIPPSFFPLPAQGKSVLQPKPSPASNAKAASPAVTIKSSVARSVPDGYVHLVVGYHAFNRLWGILLLAESKFAQLLELFNSLVATEVAKLPGAVVPPQRFMFTWKGIPLSPEHTPKYWGMTGTQSLCAFDMMDACISLKCHKAGLEVELLRTIVCRDMINLERGQNFTPEGLEMSWEIQSRLNASKVAEEKSPTPSEREFISPRSKHKLRPASSVSELRSLFEATPFDASNGCKPGPQPVVANVGLGPKVIEMAPSHMAAFDDSCATPTPKERRAKRDSGRSSQLRDSKLVEIVRPLTRHTSVTSTETVHANERAPDSPLRPLRLVSQTPRAVRKTEPVKPDSIAPPPKPKADVVASDLKAPANARQSLRTSTSAARSPIDDNKQPAPPPQTPPDRIIRDLAPAPKAIPANPSTPYNTPEPQEQPPSASDTRLRTFLDAATSDTIMDGISDNCQDGVIYRYAASTDTPPRIYPVAAMMMPSTSHAHSSQAPGTFVPAHAVQDGSVSNLAAPPVFTPRPREQTWRGWTGSIRHGWNSVWGEKK